MANFLFYSVLAVLCFSRLTVAKYTICKNPACTSLASAIRDNMITDIDACTDFFRHSCGKFDKNHKAELSANYQWNYFKIGKQTVHDHLQEILDKAKPGEHSSLMKAKNFHKACIGTSEKKREAVGAVKNYIEEAGGWPITMNTGQWENQHVTWQNVHSRFSSVIGASPIFTLSITHSSTTSGTKVPDVAPPTIGIEVPVPMSGDAVVKYLKVIKDIAKIMKEPRSIVTDTQLETDARGIFMFENNLRNKMNVGDVITIVSTITELQMLYNKQAAIVVPKVQVDWLTFIREIFAQPPSSSRMIGGSNEIRLTDQSYFKNLLSILSDTSERDIVNTIHWWFIKQTLSYANTQISEIMKEYIANSGVMKDQLPQPERWFECITVNPLKGAMGVAYIKKYFSDDARAKVNRMIKNVKTAIKNEINQAIWLDANAKMAAEAKLTAMIELIGGPDWYTDPAKADAYYHGLSISTSHFGNMLLGIKFIRQKELESLNKPANRYLWYEDPFIVNAGYHPTANSFTLHMGLMQMPFFDVHYPDAVNYAAMGSAIGHEISHGFDHNGHNYDKEGNWNNWWTQPTIQKYETQTKCFETQYNAYWPGLGTRTLNENIADTTGVKTAFEAFKEHRKTPQYKDERLPGLDHLSPEQLFFLSYASSRCGAVTKEIGQLILDKDDHAPLVLMVTGVLSNSKDFATAFNCPKDSRMNPTKKCNIWAVVDKRG